MRLNSTVSIYEQLQYSIFIILFYTILKYFRTYSTYLQLTSDYFS